MRQVADSEASRSPRRPLQVLVVDDVPEITRLFVAAARRIRSAPVVITPMIHSGRALDLARSRAFDVVVTDFRMPMVDGLEILCAARERNPSGQRWLMTGYTEVPAKAERFQLAAIAGRLQKPLFASDLVHVLEDALLRIQPEEPG